MNELDWHLLEDKPALDCVTVSGVESQTRRSRAAAPA